MKVDLSMFHSEIIGCVKISNGKFTHPNITLMILFDEDELAQKYIVVEHKDNHYPRKKDIAFKSSECSKDYLWRELSADKYMALSGAILSWDECKNKGLTSYTYLYAYCKAKGFDLHKDLGIM